jgi:putative thioredoxin
MTQQPFSRPGAIDLSALKQPAATAAPSGGVAPAGAYAIQLNEQNFQGALESSMTAPVVLTFFSRTKMPESGQLADDIATLSTEFDGRFLAGLVDIDAAPAIAQAMQIPSIPLVVLVLDGRPMPLFQDVLPIDELRTALTQVLQQVSAQGATGRHQPLGGAPAVEGGDDVVEEEFVDPRYAPAQDAIGAGDYDQAVVEYQKLLDASPTDAEAVAGLAMARVLARTKDVDLSAARAAAAESPDDIDAQTLVADLDLYGGHVEDAFSHLVDLVRRTAGDDRDKARQHLLGLFAAVGNDDPRVIRGRQNLASALF